MRSHASITTRFSQGKARILLNGEFCITIGLPHLGKSEISVRFQFPENCSFDFLNNSPASPLPCA